MRRKSLHTAILLGVVAVLGLAAVAERLRERMLAPQPLVAEPPSRPRLVQRECPGCDTLRLERSRGAWRLARPYRAAADADAVRRLLAIAAAPARHRYDAVRFDPARIGLAPPYATLAIDDLRLEFGTTDAISGKRYVRVGGAVALVADTFSTWLRAAPEAFVDPRPFADLAGIRAVEGGGQPWPERAVGALGAARAVEVVAAGAVAGGTALTVRGVDGLDYRCRLHRDGGRLVLVREDLGLGFAFDDPALAAALDAVAG